MITITGSRIRREYWMLTQQKNGDNIECVIIQGRRRISEGFWPGLILSEDGLCRFSNAMHDVISIVDNFFTNPQPQQSMRFPYFDLLAVCDGPDYTIELSSSLVGTGLKSICTTIYGKGQRFLPCLYLIDEEVWQFSQDVDELAHAWLGLIEATA